MSGYIAGFVTREQAGLRKPKSVSRNIAPKGSVIHWGGPKQNIRSHADCARVWRGWQNYHMDSKGWVDIAYSTGFCAHGYVFAGRGKGVRTAANGTNAANGSRYAHVWLGGQGNPLTEAAIAAMWWLFENFGGGAIEPHSKYRSTSCCGDDLRKAIAAGPSAVGTNPGTPGDEDDEMLKSGDTGNAVAFFQRALLAFGTSRGDDAKLSNGKTWGDARRYGADGDYGSTTEAMVKDYQRAAQVDQTGTVGGVTAALLAEYIPDKGATGGTFKHTHALSGSLSVAGTTPLGTEVAKNLKVSGRITAGSAG